MTEWRASQSCTSLADQPRSYARRSEVGLNRNTPAAPRDSWSASRRRSWATAYASGPAATAVRSFWMMICSTGAGNRAASSAGTAWSGRAGNGAKEDTASSATSPSQARFPPGRADQRGGIERPVQQPRAVPGDRGGQLVEVDHGAGSGLGGQLEHGGPEVGDPGQLGLGTERMRTRARTPG